MNQKEGEKIEQEIFISIKEKIKNLSNKDAEKIIEEEIRKRNYLQEDWQIYYAVQRIKEKVYNFIPTTGVKRFLNYILDLFLSFIFAYIFGTIMFIMGLIFLIENMNEYLLGIIITIMYYVLFESIWSKTPAKFITKTKVITEYGEKPNFKTIFIRTLLRFVPFEAFSFLSPECPRGWHDSWSKTIVIDDIKENFINPKEKIIYCSGCGNKLDNDSMFCTKCGKKII